MRDVLAERLLAKVMNWSAEDVARERPDLQEMAAYKYDEYQQFSPGMRFVESLALWLNQFATFEERRIAYDFVRRRLVFLSASEMNHLVANSYADCIRPRLLKQVAAEAGMNARHVGRVSGTVLFRQRQRQCLFLGLSDGARTDMFRRSNSPDIKHDQVLQTYETSGGRIDGLLKKLRTDLEAISGQKPADDECKFRTVVLLDDFSASGKSYIRRTDGMFDGKIGTFYRNITSENDPCSRLIELSRLEILVVLYVGTCQAREHLEKHMGEMLAGSPVRWSVFVVHELNPLARVQPGAGDPLEPILEKYYDETLEDNSTRVGGTDLKYGFSGCGLPLVLSHNTPNNSVYLLWAESAKLRGLFPRISRHRREG